VMADIVDQATRSRMMAGIRGKDTKPEKLVRKFLHAKGCRFRFRHRSLGFRPDLVLAKYNLIVFVHGCFWHRHGGCFYATTPAFRREHWLEKFAKNVERDSRQIAEARRLGWRVLVIWECGIKHHADRLEELVELIEGDEGSMEWPLEPPRGAIPSE
ncbi:DNA mismatch endonuclease Vsr, partial [Guyparkeria halopsychrophila]|uniref:very short patch repair endonuclease n=1 Tax=Guyparkeria halopsychrophila TaxID=3139421 RepID=UPI0037C7EB6B